MENIEDIDFGIERTETKVVRILRLKMRIRKFNGYVSNTRQLNLNMEEPDLDKSGMVCEVAGFCGV